MMDNKLLHINEIFESVSGESGFIPQGSWTTFIRFQGCNLRCRWCDTKKSQEHFREHTQVLKGTNYSIFDLVQNCRMRKNSNILITGGEPLMQPNVWMLAQQLIQLRFRVQIETNGSLFPPAHDFLGLGAFFVLDYKLPKSGMMGNMPPLEEILARWKGFQYMFKFVVDFSSEADLSLLLKIGVALINMGYEGKILISPLDGKGSQIPEIAKRIKKMKSKMIDQIVFSIQIHKLINLP